MVSRMLRPVLKSIERCDGGTTKSGYEQCHGQGRDACCWGSGVVRGRLGRQEIGLGDLEEQGFRDGVSGSVQCLARMKLH